MLGSAVETMVWSMAPRKSASRMPNSVKLRSRVESVTRVLLTCHADVMLRPALTRCPAGITHPETDGWRLASRTTSEPVTYTVTGMVPARGAQVHEGLILVVITTIVMTADSGEWELHDTEASERHQADTSVREPRTGGLPHPHTPGQRPQCRTGRTVAGPRHHLDPVQRPPHPAGRPGRAALLRRGRRAHDQPRVRRYAPTGPTREAGPGAPGTRRARPPRC